MEGVEAGNPTQFVTELLSELFGVDSLGDSPIIIDRAHRSLAPKPKPGERLRSSQPRFEMHGQEGRTFL